MQSYEHVLIMKNSPLHFETVKPIQEHAELIMKWRNDPTTLCMSYHSTPKIMPDFYQEFIETYFIEKQCPPVFAVKDNDRVAFLKFSRYKEWDDSNDYIVDISINVKPSARCKGIGTQVLKGSIEYLRSKDVQGVVAEIKKENIASIRAFERAGFVFIDEYEKMIDDLPGAIEVIRMYSKV